MVAGTGSGAAIPPGQPPEQPPVAPPEQPPEESPPPEPVEAPVAPEEQAPGEGEAAAPAPTGEGEAGATEEGGAAAPAPTGEGEAGVTEEGEAEPGETEAEGEEDGDEEVARGSRPDTAVAPAGILPGDLIRVPALDPGSLVVEVVPLEYGVAARTASGVVAVIPDDRDTPRWTVSAGAALIGAVDDGLVVLDAEGTIATYRIGDGKLLGSVRTAKGLAPAEAHPPVAALLPSGLVAWVSGSALVGFAPGTGQQAFELALPEGLRPVAAATVRRSAAGSRDPAAGTGPDVLLLSLGESGVAAVEVGGGGEAVLRWTSEEAGPVVAPVLADPERETVLAAENGGTLRALRLTDGRSRWRWRLGEGFDHPPLRGGERLYAATRANTLYAFDRGGGRERWRTALPGRAAASPIRLAGAVVIATRDGLLLEVNPVTGQFIGRYRALDAEITGAVGARNDEVSERGWRARRLYLGLRDGSLAVLAPRTGSRRPPEPSTGDRSAP